MIIIFNNFPRFMLNYLDNRVRINFRIDVCVRLYLAIIKINFMLVHAVTASNHIKLLGHLRNNGANESV